MESRFRYAISQTSLARSKHAIAPLILASLFLLPVSAFAMTWDEPWHDTVVADAQSFVKVQILNSNPREFRARRVKHLAGAPVPDEFSVVGFSLLKIGSATGEFAKECSLAFNPELPYYLLVKPAGAPGEYLIATPTSGWAKVTKHGVNATYRHSYHQAILPESVYELTMSAIFRRLHGDTTSNAEVDRFITKQMSLQPALSGKANSDPAAADTFFRQHAAIETLRHFARTNDLTRIAPFLAADDSHVQISAVRVLAKIPSADAKRKAMDFIRGRNHGFAKVLAIWALDQWNAREYRKQLEDLLLKMKDEETGFGGNIMDPRVGTQFPTTVKEAIKQLLGKWH
jgi:hypothetical protein